MILADHVKGLHVDEVAEPALEGCLHGQFEGADQLGTVRGEDEIEESAAEVGAHHALAGAGEKQLLDQVVDVIAVAGVRRASPAVGVEGKREVLRGRWLV